VLTNLPVRHGTKWYSLEQIRVCEGSKASVFYHINHKNGDLNMDLKDKAILITGASSGIGKAVALALSHAREL